MDETIIVPIVVAIVFIGLPWLIFHYVTKWKQAPRITAEDEKLLDELHLFARRLEDRMQTIERILAADNPDFGRISAPSPSLSETNDYTLTRRN